MKGLLGKKLGMTQVFGDNGEIIPVTVIQAGPCVVVQRKTGARDGYEAVQVAFESVPEKKINKPLKGHLARAAAGTGAFKAMTGFRYLREFHLVGDEDIQMGTILKADMFSPGDLVDVSARSKGKGFSGAIKRHGFHRGPMAHGSKYHRRPGSLGAKGPARVFKGRKLPGRGGFRQTTTQNLIVVRSDAERNLLLVRGSVPGPRNSLVAIRSAVKKA